MVAEASYAQSHGFQMSSDMSNLILERYQDLRRERPICTYRIWPIPISVCQKCSAATKVCRLSCPIFWTI